MCKKGLTASALFLLALAGCAAPPPGYRYSYVSAAGTPFYILFKIPACIATAAIAAPAAALQGLAAPNEDPLSEDIRPALDAGVDENCGPPYILPPDAGPAAVGPTQLSLATPQPVSSPQPISGPQPISR